MIDLTTFWKIWAQIRGTDQEDLTAALKALAQSEQSKTQNFWNNIIRQPCYNSQDFLRITNMFVDWYASLKTMTSTQTQITDPFSRSNDELDELFRSFGYNYSTSIKGPTSDPTSLKVNFLLDLVNLYKIKGTPQAMVEVLQYYGISDVDIYELWLEKQTANSLVFRSQFAAGTTGDVSPLYLPFSLLTANDPHWRYTEGQILTLDQNNKINLPSKSPYFAIKPIFDINSTSTAVLSRLVQDQYDTFDAGGTLDQDASVTLTGTKTSLLGLYLACVYYFNLEYVAGFNSGNNFVCYDGTDVSSVSAIVDQFDNITQSRITDRSQILTRLNQYYDLFTRVDTSNFLQNTTDAGNYLDSVDPTLKSDLASLGETNVVILESLLKDLGDWVKINISFGFVNIALILSGLGEVFSDIRNAINFFKPYHARLLPIESLQSKNRLFGTFLIEDRDFSYDLEQRLYDYFTGNGAPCCDNTSAVLCSGASEQYYSRSTYDCHSYHDIGMVTDIPREFEIYEEFSLYDALRCPIDSTEFVVSEVLNQELIGPNTKKINQGERTVSVLIPDQTSADYAINVDVVNTIDANPSVYDYVIINKRAAGFTVRFSDLIDDENYWLTYDYSKSSLSGSEPLTTGDTEKSVLFPSPVLNPNYSVAVNLSNSVDITPAMYSHSLIEKTQNGFKVQFSDAIESDDYLLEWIVYDTTTSGVTALPLGVSSANITLPAAELNDDYAIIAEITNTVDASSSIYTYLITQRSTTDFTITLSGITDSANYSLSWYIVSQQLQLDALEYYQSGSIRDFDNVGSFDCTHGFDLVQISLLPSAYFILKEDGGYLLNETGGRFYLEESPI
jgi:hypothetical protein